ncbi:hypothetical protein Nepgr_024484 [Nepenthes gracilis]|uniref:Uncharacterized protein n=1 Tax=Nepenthes gracilis TaxID=150966 RepID=A0AAD3T624_NEPGR|nr:hypothetical protein Nepgr_024484 [Nepenthes gracilis]
MAKFPSYDDLVGSASFLIISDFYSRYGHAIGVTANLVKEVNGQGTYKTRGYIRLFSSLNIWSKFSSTGIFSYITSKYKELFKIVVVHGLDEN